MRKIFFSVAILIIIAEVSLKTGSVAINFDDEIGRQIYSNIRLPRVLLGIMVGMNLALAGAILQSVLRNSLADPHIIGVTSGAGLFGIIALIYNFPVVPVGFLGAMLAVSVVLILGRGDKLILAGVAVSTLFGAGITVVLLLNSEKVQGVLMYMAGSLSARSWQEVYMILPYTIAGFFLTMILARRLNILELGDEVATGLGLKVKSTRLMFVIIAGFLAASAVSVVGMLGFVGLIMPHITRLIVGSDARILIPCSAILGGALVTACDTFARTLFSPLELPVGLIMALLGSPFFLYLLRRQN